MGNYTYLGVLCDAWAELDDECRIEISAGESPAVDSPRAWRVVVASNLHDVRNLRHALGVSDRSYGDLGRVAVLAPSLEAAIRSAWLDTVEILKDQMAKAQESEIGARTKVDRLRNVWKAGEAIDRGDAIKTGSGVE